MACAVATIVITSTLPAAAQSPSAPPYDVSLFKWSISDDAEGFDQDPLFNDLVVGDDGRVLLLGAVRSDDRVTPVVWGSDDGRAWSQLEGTLPAGSMAFDGVDTGDGFVIGTSSDVSTDGRLFRSDGRSLEPLAGPAGDLAAIERSPAGVHVLEASAAPTLWTSTDEGATWEAALVAGEDAVVRDLAVTDAGTIVALGRVHAGEDREVPTAWSSTDGGVTWGSSTLPLEPGGWVIGDLASTPLGLLARVIDATTEDATGINLVSRDGMTWEVALETPGWGSVGSAGPEAIVFGADAAWHSRDGVTWTQEWWPTLAGFDVVRSRPMPSGPVVAAGIRTSAPATGATFLGAPAPQAPPSGPIELPSSSPY